MAEEKLTPEEAKNLPSVAFRSPRYRCWNIEEEKWYGPFDLQEVLSLSFDPVNAIWFEGTGIFLPDEEKEVFEGDIVSRTCPDKDCDLFHQGLVIYFDTLGCYVIRDLLKQIEYPISILGPKGEIYGPNQILGNIMENSDILGIEYKGAGFENNGDITIL